MTTIAVHSYPAAESWLSLATPAGSDADRSCQASTSAKHSQSKAVLLQQLRLLDLRVILVLAALIMSQHLAGDCQHLSHFLPNLGGLQVKFVSNRLDRLATTTGLHSDLGLEIGTRAASPGQRLRKRVRHRQAHHLGTVPASKANEGPIKIKQVHITPSVDQAFSKDRATQRIDRPVTTREG